MYTQPPAPGFNKVSQSQLLRADRQAFLRLSELVTCGFKPNAAGTLPLDEAFDRLRNDVTVTYHMLPSPQASGKDSVKGKEKDHGDAPYNKKGKGKGKGRADKDTCGGERFPMPSELHGMHYQIPAGKAICFNFNLGKCSDKKCRRERICCVPGCYIKNNRSLNTPEASWKSGTWMSMLLIFLRLSLEWMKQHQPHRVLFQMFQ